MMRYNAKFLTFPPLKLLLEKSCRAKNERSKVINIEMGDSDEIILNGKSEVQDRRRRSKDPEPSKL